MLMPGSDRLCKDALDIFNSAVKAADPALALRMQLSKTPFPTPNRAGRTILIAVGKAAPQMLEEALKHVTRPCVSLAITHYENPVERASFRLLKCGHPVPDSQGLAAGEEVLRLVTSAQADDQVVLLASGGGSALLPAPVEGVSLDDKSRTNQLLLESGLDITEMNLVRQQLSRLKGGGLAAAAFPAPVAGYILSDVIGDDLRVVASGPTVAPIGTRLQAQTICRRAQIWTKLPRSVQTHLSAYGAAPKDVPEATNHLIGSNRRSLEAALGTARLSHSAKIVSSHLVGDVESAAEFIVSSVQSSQDAQINAFLFGGETTVRVTGDGLGGRNQELALRVALLAEDRNMGGDWVFLSGGTDGRDGPTTAAGGFVNAQTCEKMRAAGLDPTQVLAKNDSFHGLSAADALLVTGATGTNVADIQIFLRASAIN